MKTKLLLLVFLLGCTKIGFTQFKSGFFMQNGSSLTYKVSFPDNYDESKRYPLILFLHGAGERGDDNEKQLFHGKSFLLDNTKSKYPAIVIAPQCPENSYWTNTKLHTIEGIRSDFSFGYSDVPTASMNTLICLIEDWLSSGRVDLRQVYVGGLSMGGMGTYELLWRMPNIFTAAFPICGGGDTEKVKIYAKNTSIWIFHGSEDGAVPVINSHKMYDALKNAGCNVKYTEYPGVNHNSWDNVFKEKDFFSWLFSCKKQ